MNQAALHRLLATSNTSKSTEDYTTLFHQRLSTNLTLISSLFFSLYPEKEQEVYFHKLLAELETLFSQRPKTLKKIDLERVKQGNWYQSEQLVGMQLYVDRFNKDIKGLAAKLPYFNDLGINFLHLMPITTRPAGENDGGYAVNSYHDIDPKYGTKKDFAAFTKKARSKNMILMLDFVVNHTSDEFSWAQKAKAGDQKYQNYYYTYPDRQLPDEFEKTMPEIFPESAPGSFTFSAEMNKWVMSCFNNYQWDLNYANPEVFIKMLANLVQLANMGVDVVRFDALAFLWKKLGTDSQNLPEAHQLISLFRMCLQVVAPGVVLLAEAIVAPRNILKYFGENHLEGNQCEIAYNASLMALLWDAMATKKTSLLQKSILEIPSKPIDATWINYVRCHDDIGLGYDDNFIKAVGWTPFDHRKFLLDFYGRNLEWSSARGQLFMYNPKNGDGRITGSTASLLGLEKAIEQESSSKVATAIAKIIMLHGIILTYGGIPLIYAGDEIATLNNYDYTKNKDQKNDSRWLNRPMHDWKVVNALKKKNTPSSTIYFALKNMITLRKQNPVFADTNAMVIHPCPNPHVFVVERNNTNKKVWIVSNFDENTQELHSKWLQSIAIQPYNCKDLITESKIQITNTTLILQPYQHLWLVCD